MDFTTPAPRTFAALLSRAERFRTPGRFGNLQGPQLRSILDDRDQGGIELYADFCTFALSTDAHLLSLHTTHTTRVSQASYQVRPCPYGDRHLAKDAAEFIDECLSKVDNLTDAIREMAGAITYGVSAHEMRWTDDRTARIKYVDHLEMIPAHRFRYDEQWNLRLYDGGARRSKSSPYGELLRPDLWVLHHHQEQNTYPSHAGVFASCSYDWMFRRWADVAWATFLERYGSPFAWAEVVKDAPGDVRAGLLTALDNLAASHSMTVEEGTKIHFETGGAASGASEIHEKYQLAKERSMTKAYLGTSDAVDPGANGARAAVETRAGAAMDPRMVAAGMSICATLRGSLFKWLLLHNTHVFGGRMPPIPEMAFRTASDEVETDEQDAVEQAIPEGGRPAELSALPFARTPTRPLSSPITSRYRKQRAAK